jgi:hypothetical protein
LLILCLQTWILSTLQWILLGSLLSIMTSHQFWFYQFSHDVCFGRLR